MNTLLECTNCNKVLNKVIATSILVGIETNKFDLDIEDGVIRYRGYETYGTISLDASQYEVKEVKVTCPHCHWQVDMSQWTRSQIRQTNLYSYAHDESAMEEIL